MMNNFGIKELALCPSALPHSLSHVVRSTVQNLFWKMSPKYMAVLTKKIDGYQYFTALQTISLVTRHSKTG